MCVLCAQHTHAAAERAGLQSAQRPLGLAAALSPSPPYQAMTYLVLPHRLPPLLPPPPPSPPPPPPLSPFPPSLLTPLFPRPRPLLFPCCSAGGEFSRFKAFEPAAPVGTPYVYQFVPNQTFAIYPQVRACDTCVERAPPCIVLPSTLLPPAGCLHCMFMACAHACHEHLSSQDLLQSVNPPGPAVL